MNSIKLKEIAVTDKTCVRFKYEVEGEWAACFSPLRSTFAEYTEDISSVPFSVLAVTFVCNILPAVWLCDASLEVESLDSDFLDHVEDIKNGYRKMYPMLSFKGSLKSGPEKNEPAGNTGGAACFFSGGVDAHTSFFKHIDEKPALLTVWGADIKLNDKEGWDSVRTYTEQIAETYGVNCLTVRSDFRDVLIESRLDQVVSASKEHWWHGFQNSIAIISLAAAFVYLHGWSKLYLASSFSEDIEGEYTGSSIPSIDDNVCFCGCRTCHDGYELNRQQKIRYLTETKNSIKLRVCWESSGGRNCSSCEKCYRTILGLVAEGVDPDDYGFVWDHSSIERCRKDFSKRIEIYEYDYHPIQDRMIANSSQIPDIDSYKWFIDMDLSKVNSAFSKRAGKALHSIKKKLCKVIKGV